MSTFFISVRQRNNQRPSPSIGPSDRWVSRLDPQTTFCCENCAQFKIHFLEILILIDLMPSSNRIPFPCSFPSVIVAGEGLGSFQKVCKLKTQSMVCITFENCPNHPSVSMRLCKHGRSIQLFLQNGAHAQIQNFATHSHFLTHLSTNESSLIISQLFFKMRHIHGVTVCTKNST